MFSQTLPCLPNLLVEAEKYKFQKYADEQPVRPIGEQFNVQTSQWRGRAALSFVSGLSGAVLVGWEPPLQAAGFGCTQAAVSVCFIHHFE